jgi:putative addiction module component (TIGR02574 family)
LPAYPDLIKVLSVNAALAAEIERLSPAEKLLLVEELWNQIARESNAVEPPAWHDKVLAEDADRYAADPSRGDSWENVRRRIAGDSKNRG